MISVCDRRLPISLLVSKALLIVKALSDSTFGIKSAFDSKSAFRYHFWMQKCKIGAFGDGSSGAVEKRPQDSHRASLCQVLVCCCFHVLIYNNMTRTVHTTCVHE